MAIGPNYGYTNGGYITTVGDGTIISGGAWSGGTSYITIPPHPALFALACLALGLDTPEQRAAFRYVFNIIQPGWGEEYTYEFLIKEAYKIKYPNDEHID